jgi:hypothetical protein
MNRWSKLAFAGLALVSCLAFSQGIIRHAPADVKPAMMAVSATPPDITLNGEPARLSPGARIRNVNNLLVLSGSLAGQTLPTVYRRDAAGLVHEVWLLTPDEYRKIGGVNAGDPDGFKRFYELLDLVFSMRSGVK